MDTIERLGEVTLRVLQRAYYHALGFLIWLILVLRKLGRLMAGFESRRIYPFFESRGVEFRDYVVLKAQLLIFIYFIAAVLYIFGFAYSKALVVLILAGAALLLLVTGQLRQCFASDYPPYRDFFLAYLLLTTLLVLVKLALPELRTGYPYLHLLLISVAGVLAFTLYFKHRYSRDYTYGRVVRGGSVARVRVSYDIRAGVKPGEHLVHNQAGAEEGDLVKLRVERGIFNLRGGRVSEILEVVGDEEPD